MKKKIIYFCASVLLTSLILVAIQVAATAPNPGHEIGDINGDISGLTLAGRTFRTFMANSGVIGPYNFGSGTCAAYCSALGGFTCNAACNSAYPACIGCDHAYCNSGYRESSMACCKCNLTGFYPIYD